MGKDTNFVVFGLGSISNRIIEGIIESGNSKLYGVCSSNTDKIEKVKNIHNNIVGFEKIEDLVNDKNIDIVYLSTPNFVHFEQIEFLLKNKISVICEKPMCVKLEELEELFSLAKGNKCFLMEAQKTVFSPLLNKVIDIILTKGLFNIVKIMANYNDINFYNNKDKQHWVFDKDYGGANLDLGGYPVSFVLTLFKHFGIEIKNYKKEFVFSKDNVVEDYSLKLLGDTGKNDIEVEIESSWIKGDPKIKGFAKIEFFDGDKIYIQEFWKNNKATIIHPYLDEEIIEVDKQSDFRGEIEHASYCIQNKFTESPVVNYEFTKRLLELIKVD